jgi:hypothetical protein
MKTLKLTLLMILLAGSAAAQVSSSTSSAAPDVTVLKIRWRRVERSNPRLNQPTQTGNPEDALKMAVNTARINEYNSARDSGANPRPPALLSAPSNTYSPAPPMSMWAGFIYEFTVRNTGSKVIRKLVWEYSFTDPATQRTVGRRQYKSSVKILPGMTAKLVVRSSSPPLGIINVAQAGAGQNSQDQSPEQMLIQSIKYADGSVWQRGSK